MQTGSDMTGVALPWGEIEYRMVPAAQPGRPTLVLLHEGLASAGLWRDFPDALAAATGCGALVYSRYGYGYSDTRPLPWANSYMHDEAINVLPALLRYLHVQQYVLIGHSDGGSVALIHAGGTLARGLRGVVTLAAHVFTEPSGQASIAATEVAYDTGGLRERLARHHADVDTVYRGWHDTWLRPDFEATWDLQCYLPGIRVPTLVVQGRDDQYGTLAQVEAIVRGCAGPAEKLVFGDCGHAIHRDRRDELIAAIAAFVAARA